MATPSRSVDREDAGRNDEKSEGRIAAGVPPTNMEKERIDVEPQLRPIETSVTGFGKFSSRTSLSIGTTADARADLSEADAVVIAFVEPSSFTSIGTLYGVAARGPEVEEEPDETDHDGRTAS